jgi:hypothetical protein
MQPQAVPDLLITIGSEDVLTAPSHRIAHAVSLLVSPFVRGESRPG